jgi:hypothetical protein
MKQVLVTWRRPEGDVTESAKLARVTKNMLPLPTGYVPVRFAYSGVLLVHSSAVKVAA